MFGIEIPFLCFSLAPKGREHRISEQNTSKQKNAHNAEEKITLYRNKLTTPVIKCELSHHHLSAHQLITSPSFHRDGGWLTLKNDRISEHLIDIQQIMLLLYYKKNI